MKKQTRRPVRSRAMLGALLTLLSAPWLGCSESKPAEPTPVDSQSLTSEARFSISLDEDAGPQKPGFVSAQAIRAQDVTRITVDVFEQGQAGQPDSPLFINFDLALKPGTTTEWAGTLPFLPRGKVLVFFAKAYSAASPTTPIFSGTTYQQLDADFSSVAIRLKPATDAAQIALPRIARISIPSAFTAGQAGNISFFVEANTGERLTYAVTASTSSSSGAFFPTSGAITLLTTSGTFVSQYLPGSVTTDTEFTHTVKVTNEAGHSVTTTFKTKVKPAGTTSGVDNTEVLVLFNPVINGLDGYRAPDSSDVVFTATVDDDGPADALRYAWSFTPADGTTPDPLPVFSGQTNPTTFQNYATSVRGTLRLAVTDEAGAGGTTTLSYNLTPNQFPNNQTQEGPLSGINTIRAGENFTCALFNNGNVRCWGRNLQGQLGYGNTLPVGTTASNLPHTAGDVPLLGTGTRLAVGGNHACALLSSGLVRCWGSNLYGQLGYNSTENVGDGEPISSFGYVNLGGNAVKLAAGLEHTCALMDTQKVRCWGRNNSGQLGYGNTQNIGDNEQPWRAGDVDVGGPVKDIVAGSGQTCALRTDGNVRCWGNGANGRLGYGSTTNVNNPASVGNVNVGGPVRQLAAGYNHTCALLETGTVKCWGHNFYGQLGNGTAGSGYDVYTPTSDVNLGTPTTRAIQVVAGEQHTCALLDVGTVKCWGTASSGQLGYGTSTAQASPPAATVNLDGTSVYQLTAGASHTCALLSTGSARCWGSNASGQLGIGSTSNVGASNLPTEDVKLSPPTPAP
ncbi:RTX toxin [Pyxidicoccus sp. MSG2]|uniref:RCC1 domain-containing protein n=1 Tax=Pyxidicoccus sp. MSG2 TaxID=2996790 RepID=UPI0022705B38|nr:RTX toxin [Pyxidicoccus sp. MSG2]MCY1018414.1 RTX toxin [Pyxidicoccus sp. MSG2]